jgi:hypothetical protein
VRRSRLRRDVLEQEPAGARADRGGDGLVEVERREHDDPQVRVGLQRPPGGLDAVEARHADVHQDDVHRRAVQHREGLDAVGGLGDDGEVVARVEHHREARPDQLLVVDEQEAHGVVGHVRSSRSGRCGRTGVSCGR